MQSSMALYTSVFNGPVDLAQPGRGYNVSPETVPRARQNGKGNLLEHEFLNDWAPKAPHASVGVDAM